MARSFKRKNKNIFSRYRTYLKMVVSSAKRKNKKNERKFSKYVFINYIPSIRRLPMERYRPVNY